MQGIEVSYLSAVAVGLCLMYIVLYFLYQIVFGRALRGMKKHSFRSMLMILVLSAVIYIVSFYVIPDKVLGNRFLHAFGGGFVVFFICLSAVRDAKLRIGNKALFISAFMVVTLLGLMNEAVEIFLQQHIHYLFAPSAMDTLLDLVSNTVGFLIASVSLVRIIPIAYPSGQKRSEALQ